MNSPIVDKWQPFISVADTVWPDNAPFKVEVMKSDGERHTMDFKHFDTLDDLDDCDDYIAIRIFDVVDEETRMVRQLIADHMPGEAYRFQSKYAPQQVRGGSLDEHYTTEVVRGILQTYGLTPKKVDVNPFIPEVVKSVLPPKYWKRVFTWMYDLNSNELRDYQVGNDYVEEKLANRVLAVRPHGRTGKRVIIPCGHSIAYSYAREAYWQIMESGTLSYVHKSKSTVPAGELSGRSLYMRTCRYDYDSCTKTISVGCQKIPFQALAELAKREGWPDKSLY